MSEKIKLIKKIFSGYAHTFFHTTNDEVYGFGYNKDGELGVNIKEKYNHSPTLVKLPNKEQIKSIFCGYLHTIFQSKNNSLYSCGYNVFGQLGLDDKKNRILPTKITFFGKKNLRIVACGGYHNIFLGKRKNNVMYGCGCNDSGELLKKEFCRFNKISELNYPWFLKGNIKDIICGCATTFILTKKNKLFGIGCNDDGRLGAEKKVNSSIPVDLNVESVISGSIDKFCYGSYHGLILSSDKTVYSFGLNDKGQLGIGKKHNNEVKIHKIEFPRNKSKIWKIKVGYVSSHLIFENGEYYGWGCNSDSLLDGKRKSADKIFSPVLLNERFNNCGIANLFISPLSSQYYFLISKSGNLFSVGKFE